MGINLQRTGILLVLLFFLATSRGIAEAPFSGFIVGEAGRIGTAPEEVIAGTRSVVGSNQGAGQYRAVLMSDRTVLRLRAGATYTLHFRYRILSAPDKGFEVLFYSPTAGAKNQWLPSQRFTGSAGKEGDLLLKNTLGPFDDYQALWNIIGKGAIAIDSVSLVENDATIPVAESDFEPPKLSQGLLPFVIHDSKSLPLGSDNRDYWFRSASLRDLDGDGKAEAVVTVTTYPDQLLKPVIVLGSRGGISDIAPRLFPQGIPRLKHSPYIYFPDIDGDRRADIVCAEAGLDVEPWTGSRIVVALDSGNGTYRDVSDKIPEDLWETRSYAIAIGNLTGDSRPEILLPDQSKGERTALLTWKNGTFSVTRNWIDNSLWQYPGMLAANNWLGATDLDGDRNADLIVGGRWDCMNTRIIFGRPRGLVANSMITLPDGVFGHTGWDEWGKADSTAIQGADCNIIIPADLDNDGRIDLFILHEQIFLYKPGAIADREDPYYEKLRENGGMSFGDEALQVFRNEGKRNFIDISSSSERTMLGRRYYMAHFLGDYNFDGFPDVLATYWRKPYGDDRRRGYGTTLFLNDGTGSFQIVEGSELFPTLPSSFGALVPLELGAFLPTVLTPERTEGFFVASTNENGSGSLDVMHGSSDKALGTGPGFEDSARLGFPGYNEYYYLRTHPDARAAVAAGQFANGLEHYKAVGLLRGYQAFAANATVLGISVSDTLHLACRKAACTIRKIEGGYSLVDSSGAYGKLTLKGIRIIHFSDGELRL